MAYFFPPFHLVPSTSRSLIHKTKVKIGGGDDDDDDDGAKRGDDDNNEKK